MLGDDGAKYLGSLLNKKKSLLCPSHRDLQKDWIFI
jgi:hypothetical protein